MNFLAGDLGGTKTLLAIFKWDQRPIKLHQKKYYSKSWDSFYAIINDFKETIPDDVSFPSYCCIGVAGPIKDNSSHITNLEWEVNGVKIAELLNMKGCEIINDFSVLLYGIKYLNKSQYKCVQGPNPCPSSLIRENQIFAVIGAGTGLGMARGVLKNNNIHSFPSEGGHQEFPTKSDKEWEISKWIRNDLKINRISLERIVSGSGLGHIGRWRLMKSDAKSHPLRNIAKNYLNGLGDSTDFPSKISKGAKEGDPMLSEVFEIWIKAYGSIAGDFALHELCYGGLWIAGGAAAKNVKEISSKIFLESFRDKGRFRQFLEKIPIMIIIDQEIGIFSAACKAHINAESNGRLK